MAKQVLFFNPNFEQEKAAKKQTVHSGIGEVLEEVGGLVTKVVILTGGASNVKTKKVIDTTNMIVEYIGIANQLAPHVKALFVKIFGSKEQRAAKRVLKKTRKSMNEYDKLNS